MPHDAAACTTPSRRVPVHPIVPVAVLAYGTSRCPGPRAVLGRLTWERAAWRFI